MTNGTSPYDQGYDGDHASRQSEESDDEPPTRGVEVLEDAEVVR